MKVLTLLLDGLYDGLVAFGAEFWNMPVTDFPPEEVRDEQ